MWLSPDEKHFSHEVSSGTRLLQAMRVRNQGNLDWKRVSHPLFVLSVIGETRVNSCNYVPSGRAVAAKPNDD
jgi:hypothetical protein